MSSPSLSPGVIAASFSIEDSYGALLLGVVAEVGLVGVITMQTWIYWLKYGHRDNIYKKITVLVLWVLEFLRACLGVQAVYHYLVIEWGNELSLIRSIWSVDINLPLTAVVQLIVHCFFIYRVKVLSKNNWYLVGFIFIMALGNFGMTIALYVLTFTTDDFATNESLLVDFLPAVFATIVTADIIITCSLLYYINRYRSSIDQKRTVPVLNRLSYYIVNIGTITVLGDVVVLILWRTRYPKILNTHSLSPSLQYFAMYGVVGCLYANSLLATFNTRDSLKDISDRHETSEAFNPDLANSRLVFAPPETENSNTIMISTPSMGMEGFEKPSQSNNESNDAFRV